ncbi:hypothetical protein JB92DRAFT_2829062 [Gautieria morchelliformis]|nr:hypothetical protein JB92DRAFT_2829062 [Gautieria morchelliformis]
MPFQSAGLTGTETTSVERQTLLSNEQQTISLLVNEKASLVTQLAKLEALQTKFPENQDELEQERNRAENLAVRLQHAEDKARTTVAHLDEIERHEMSRTQGITAIFETLERSVSATQDRTEELKFQLSKVRQSPELTSHARQLHATEDVVISAQRRAEDTEQAQRSLQAENSGLLAQLEEVRPKVVQLINRNAEADGRIWAAEKERAQAEIESLRDQLALREDAPASSSSRPHSPTQEGQRSLSQQMHTLDLSTAHSRIHALEAEVFEAQAAAHTFQRRVRALGAELVQLNTDHIPDVVGRSTTPFPCRASFHDGSGEFSSALPQLNTPPYTVVILFTYSATCSAR